MAGHADDLLERDDLTSGVPLLVKPLPPDTLLKRVCRALDGAISGRDAIVPPPISSGD